MYLTGVIVTFFVSFLILMYQSSTRIRNGEETLVYGFIVSVVTSFILSLFSWIAVVLFAYIYFKKRKLDRESMLYMFHNNRMSKLYSDNEKLLLFRSQEVMRINNNCSINLGKDIFRLAKLIDDSRIEYQIMNEGYPLEINFMEFLLPKIEILKLEITDWENVKNYFEIE